MSKLVNEGRGREVKKYTKSCLCSLWTCEIHIFYIWMNEWKGLSDKKYLGNAIFVKKKMNLKKGQLFLGLNMKMFPGLGCQYNKDHTPLGNFCKCS